MYEMITWSEGTISIFVMSDDCFEQKLVYSDDEMSDVPSNCEFSPYEVAHIDTYTITAIDMLTEQEAFLEMI